MYLFFSIVRYYIVLYCVVSFSTVHYIILHYIILYYIILYYNLLCHVMLYYVLQATKSAKGERFRLKEMTQLLATVDRTVHFLTAADPLRREPLVLLTGRTHRCYVCYVM
jgi:hypothetical protein